MRAVEPLASGQLKLHGFQIGYETFGDLAGRPFLLLAPWQIVHSRIWKMQVPFLARFGYVVTLDPPGNGLGERTADPAAFQYDRIVDQAAGLLDHLGIDAADVLCFSRSCYYGLLLAARFPQRVHRLVLIGNGVSPDLEPVADPAFWQEKASYDEWEKWNGHYWLAHYEKWLAFFFSQVFSEAHSTKPFDDSMKWGLETTPHILARTTADITLYPTLSVPEIIAGVRCPALIIHGEDDRITDIEASRQLAAACPDFEFVTLAGSGHAPHVRDPVKINELLREFLELRRPTRRKWRRAMTRRQPRALFISSPIGLGHVQRDLAIAGELRRLIPELQIEWLAQPPVTQVLAANQETIHPLSARLASESAHWEASAAEHDLHCFYAWRQMDEILLANFMVFLDVVRETAYDLWIGDEAWEVDYYLHENPELKSAPFVFLTDFLGWIPIDRTAGSREALLTADYNAEMIKQVERFRRVRDLALYVGEYEDLWPGRFGPGLPAIPEWAQEYFTAIGEYIVNFDPADYAETGMIRQRLGYEADRPLVLVAVGGTAVGRDLLAKACEAWSIVQRVRPETRCLVVAGPRIDPAKLPEHPGLEIRSYVHNLFEHLSVADLAVVQGGLSTTMELVVNRRPFIYFPLQNHCEQVYHVAHRLDRYRAGRRLVYARTSPEDLAETMLATLETGESVVRPYRPGATARAAALIAAHL